MLPFPFLFTRSIRQAVLVLLLLFAKQGVQAQTEENNDTLEVQAADNEDNSYFRRKSPDDTLILHQRQIPAGKPAAIKKQDDFWYADREFSNKEKREELQRRQSRRHSFTEDTWFTTLVWLVIIASFAGAIMWFLADSQVGIFRRKDRFIENGEDNGDLSTDDIFAINYQREIDKATREGNFRLAIRLQFLRLLKEMSERNLIQYKQDRTNLDYILQLQGSRYYTSFFRLARNYEYAWYGLFEVTPDIYNQVRLEFSTFERTLS